MSDILDQAYEALSTEDFEKAEAMFTLCPHANERHTGLALCYFKRFRRENYSGDLDLAIENAKQALEADNGDHQAMFLIAQCLATKHFLTQAGYIPKNGYQREAEELYQRAYDSAMQRGADSETLESIKEKLSLFKQGETARFTKRSEVLKLYRKHPNALFYDTSSNAPFAENYDFVSSLSDFSPFVPYGNIPVPEQTLTSDSVEGVWQGLKVIKGRTDFSYFKGKGRKRKGQPKGHLLGNKVIGYIEARKNIYVPTYRFMVMERVPQKRLEQLVENAKRGITQFFFDVDENGDTNQTNGPLAHSAILLNLINELAKQ